MRSEVEGALSLAIRHLTTDSIKMEKHIIKAQKHLERVRKYGGPNIYIAKDHSKRRWVCNMILSRRS